MSHNKKWIGRNPEKDKLRNSIWTALSEKGISIGETFHAIPDFIGSDRAAELLTEIDEWKTAKVMMACPDVPQIPVRYNALKDGMTVYMAIPKLVDEKCFVELKRETILEQKATLEEVSTWQGAMKYGKPVSFQEMLEVDITVTGCVAVTRSGGRTGKGAGFADLEYSLMRKFNKITDKTPVITTVHPLMIVPEERLPLQKHDTYLTMIATPDEIIRIDRDRPQPKLDWSFVKPDQFETIPILRKLLKEEGADNLFS